MLHYTNLSIHNKDVIVINKRVDKDLIDSGMIKINNENSLSYFIKPSELKTELEQIINKILDSDYPTLLLNLIELKNNTSIVVVVSHDFVGVGLVNENQEIYRSICTFFKQKGETSINADRIEEIINDTVSLL